MSRLKEAESIFTFVGTPFSVLEHIMPGSVAKQPTVISQRDNQDNPPRPTNNKIKTTIKK